MKICICSSEIRAKNEIVAEKINNYYSNQEYQDKVLVVGVLNGAFIFMADLIRLLNFSLETDFVRISSYGNACVSSGHIQFLKDVETSVKGRRILIVEDVIETGQSLAFLRNYFLSSGAKEVKTVVFFNKKVPRTIDVPIDFAAWETKEFRFLVGYGLDYQGGKRELPDLWEM
ncbi:MAG: hypoxanthine phosphoribosyltransferase [Planctomycetia bacterium]|nr:hypoxanthine phosphoribosyltransferase [Planctomycetia bacterium]